MDRNVTGSSHERGEVFSIHRRTESTFTGWNMQDDGRALTSRGTKGAAESLPTNTRRDRTTNSGIIAATRHVDAETLHEENSEPTAFDTTRNCDRAACDDDGITTETNPTD